MQRLQTSLRPFADSAVCRAPARVAKPTSAPVTLRLRPQGAADGSTASAKSLLWEAFVGRIHVGYAGLDYAPPEFDINLRRCGPALRLYILPKFRRRGLGSKVAQTFMAHLRASGFSQPLLASHLDGDEAAQRILSRCGFLYTGCRLQGVEGQTHVQLVALP